MTEQELILDMQSMLQEKMEKDYAKGKTKRDAHPKCLALLKGHFKIIENLPNNLQIGLFQPGKSYKSFIRISNASGRVQSDKIKDFRGFAIKLIEVDGKRFDTTEKQTQDFLMISLPIMPLGTIKLFRDAVYYAIKWNPLVLALKMIFSGNGKILKALNNAKKNEANPLDLTYWSTTPYMYGNKQIKFKIVPTSTSKSELPKILSDNYLTKNMESHLQKNIVKFDFFIQPFVNEKNTPIENAGIEWNSPFIKVAEIEIPIQDLNTEERFELAEQLSFSPSNSLEAHKPIGGINRARIEIYKALSKFRHQRDNKTIIEPTLNNFNI
ncbi:MULTISPECIES: catalase [Flavobacterium]|uniref:Catalase n=2 Tax=Flavobacterium TaxID=237 RepID=A0A2N9PCT8_9FLAO|nr:MULTISPECIES: catalase [Flavobacterium]QYS88753.1 catalase [Flavobacterium davisii]RVU89932.1 catalase [Flavobacterium columnare]SPE78176.1 Catalase [Flavobacterium columnare]